MYQQRAGRTSCALEITLERNPSPRLNRSMARNFKDLSDAEILALAISNEETDGRVYADFAARLRDNYPATAEVFKKMKAEEENHRRGLIDEYRRRFGEHIPLIRREDVKGFIS